MRTMKRLTLAASAAAIALMLAACSQEETKTAETAPAAPAETAAPAEPAPAPAETATAPAPAEPPPAAPAETAAASGSPVRITDQARMLAALEQAVQSLPVVNEARVSEIRLAIEEGRYEVVPERIADKLLRLDQELRAADK